MVRSKWKGNFVDISVVKQFDRTKKLCFFIRRAAFRIALQSVKKEKLKLPWFFPEKKVKVTSATINNLIIFKDALKEIEVLISQDSGIEIWSLRSTILSSFLNIFCKIYNGNKLIPLKINKDMLNRKFGEFCYTKKMGQNIHYIKARKKKKKQKLVKNIKTNKFKNIQLKQKIKKKKE